MPREGPSWTATGAVSTSLTSLESSRSARLNFSASQQTRCSVGGPLDLSDRATGRARTRVCAQERRGGMRSRSEAESLIMPRAGNIRSATIALSTRELASGESRRGARVLAGCRASCSASPQSLSWLPAWTESTPLLPAVLAASRSPVPSRQASKRFRDAGCSAELEPVCSLMKAASGRVRGCWRHRRDQVARLRLRLRVGLTRTHTFTWTGT
jgi:hypothetical protein